MSEFHVRKFKKDHRIFNVGARGDACYILRSGSVEISIDKAGRKVVLAVLEPPVVFGEMALLLEDSERTATAIAQEDSELVILEREKFNEYLSDPNNPKWVIIANQGRKHALENLNNDKAVISLVELMEEILK